MKTTFAVIMLLPLAICAAPPARLWPTQQEAQQQFDRAILDADQIEVAPLLLDLRVGEPLLFITDQAEIREVGKCFRLLIPNLTEVADGTERRIFRTITCACYDGFRIIVRKENQMILDIVVAHGDLVSCPQLWSDGMISVDPVPMAPLYGRLVELLPPEDARRKQWNEKAANHALQTTPMTRSVYERTIEFGRPQRGV